jgi:hypothetical protein
MAEAIEAALELRRCWQERLCRQGLQTALGKLVWAYDVDRLSWPFRLLRAAEKTCREIDMLMPFRAVTDCTSNSMRRSNSGRQFRRR